MENNENNQTLYTVRDVSTRKILRLSDIFHTLIKHIRLIIICLVAGLLIGIALSVLSYMRGEMTKRYEIDAAFAVTAQNKNGLYTTESEDPDNADIQLAEDLVDAVIYVMRSDATLNAAAEKLNLLGVSTSDIRSCLTLYQYDETQIIEIALYWRSAEEGTEILNAILEVAPDVLLDTLNIGNVSIINNPTSSYIIGGSINAAIWIVTALLGAAMGIGIAILQLLIRPTLTNVRDMESVFSLEILGEIPERKQFFRKKRNLLLDNGQNFDDSDALDSFTSLAHIIKSRLKKVEHPCIYITSSTEGEGKTTITANLAVQLSELGLKILVIDFDIRNPKLGGLFLDKVSYEHSINALYRGDADATEAITNLTGTLDILPAVLERLSIPLDDEMLDLICTLKPKYDLILIDTAPIGLVAETMTLNQIADVSILVVSYDSVSMNEIRDCLERLDKSDMPIIGCVVNSVKDANSIKKSTTNHNNYGNGSGAHNNVSSKHKNKTQKSERQEEWDAWERKHGETQNEQENKSPDSESAQSESVEVTDSDHADQP